MEMTNVSPGKAALGVFGGLFFAVALGCLVPFSSMLLAQFTPLQLAAVLTLTAGIGVGVVFLVRKLAHPGADAEALTREDAPALALVTALNAAAIAFLMIGVSHTLATNASLLLGFEVAAATIFAWTLAHRHVCYKAIAAVALICVASMLLCWNVSGTAVFVPESLLLVLASACWALASHFEKTLADKDPWAVVGVKELVGGIVLAALAFAVDGMPAATAPAIAEAAVLGFAACGLAAVLLAVAWRTIGTARADGWSALAPFAGLIVSWGLFGLSLEPLLFGSLAFMALGVWLAMDDSVFHEDYLAEIDQETAFLYTSDTAAFGFDRMHRPLG